MVQTHEPLWHVPLGGTPAITIDFTASVLSLCESAARLALFGSTESAQSLDFSKIC
jgi:hypothetical protein